MSLLPLEEKARFYAKKAVIADRNGVYDEAIKYYKKAIELFSTLIRLYPEAHFTSIYASLIKQYSNRIQVLEQYYSEAYGAGIKGNGPGRDSTPFEILYPGKRYDITFKDIVGLESVKNALKKAIIYPIRQPEYFPLGWPRGILLFGPPGCGKTYVALALANEANAILIQVSAANIMSKWLGEAEKNVAKLFKTARELAMKGEPVIIFIDEVDGLLRVYSDEVGGEARVRNQFLMEMDGLQDKGSKLLLFIVGATNKPWLLDIGFIRRFQKRIYVPPPDKKTRIKLFKHFLEKIGSKLKIDQSVDVEKLAELTEGYSSFDIESIAKEVVANVVSEHFEKTGGEGEPRPITMEDFIRVIKEIKPSIDERMIKAYGEWAKKYKSI
ncbi:MAG: AAA family ATPase [Desulfurococcales archaeon]|nr:AAA family ATPase [Desulfurococcales archaeon]